MLSWLQQIFAGGASVPELTPAELKQRLAKQSFKQIQVIDVRERDEVAGGVIPGAVNIPLSQLRGRVKELNPDEELVIVCRSGNRSFIAAQQLLSQGFTRVWNLRGGMLAWEGPVSKLQVL